jgi:hypothetical protein
MAYVKAPLEEIQEEDIHNQSVDMQKDGRSTEVALSADKKRIFISMLISIGITQTLYMNMATFLPTYSDKHHPSINGGQMGLILC